MEPHVSDATLWITDVPGCIERVNLFLVQQGCSCNHVSQIACSASDRLDDRGWCSNIDQEAIRSGLKHTLSSCHCSYCRVALDPSRQRQLALTLPSNANTCMQESQ